MDGLKYTKYGIAFGLIVVTVGIALTLKYGYRPAPKRIMKPSYFDKPEQIGAVALKRFYAQLANEYPVILGLPTSRNWSKDVALGFAMAAKENQREFAKIFVEKKMDQALRDALATLTPNLIEIETNTQSLSELGDAVTQSMAQKVRILVVMPNIYSTHLVEGNPISRLEALVDRPGRKEGKAEGLFSVTVGPLALEAAQEKEIEPICIGSERDGSGTANLGCAIIMAGRGFYRKQILESEPGIRSRYIAVMQEPKPNDYLLLVREPSAK